MNIMDGFNLWLGKALADLAVFGAVVGLIVLPVLILWGLDRFNAWKRRKGTGK